MTTRAQLRAAAGIAAMSVAVTACPPAPPPSGFEEALRECQVERRTVKTAYDASAADLDPAATVHAYLSEPTAYFTLEAGPTTGPVARSASSLASVPEPHCVALSIDEVPLGSD